MKFKVYRDAADEWRWQLVARNGRIVAESGEGYTRAADCLHAILTFRREVREAPIARGRRRS